MSEELVVDVHEPTDFQENVIEYAAESDDIESVDIKPLETGDVVYGDMVFERKEAGDYLSSITDHRLSDQSKRMRDEFDEGYVLLEGDPYNQEYGSGIHDHSIIGQATSLASKRGIHIIPTNDIDGSAYATISCIEKSFDRGKEVRVNNAVVDALSTGESILCQIDGISPAKADKITDKVDFDELVKSTIEYKEAGKVHLVQDMLEEIDGIGPTLSSRIVQAFTG